MAKKKTCASAIICILASLTVGECFHQPIPCQCTCPAEHMVSLSTSPFVGRRKGLGTCQHSSCPYGLH